MVVYRHDPGTASFVKQQGIVVFHILYDKKILAPYGFEYLGLDFSVGKKAEPGGNPYMGAAVFKNIAGNGRAGRKGILDKIKGPYHPVPVKLVVLHQFLDMALKIPAIQLAQMDNNFFGEFFASGAGQNAKICGIVIIHE
jgi:hypothetical protein